MREKIIVMTDKGAYLAVPRTGTDKISKCYKCNFYKHCPKGQLGPCDQLKFDSYLAVPNIFTESCYVSPYELDFSNAKVKFRKKVQHKCDLVTLIHTTEFMLLNKTWPLVTDIYPENYRYDELKAMLKRNCETLIVLMRNFPLP